MKLNDINDALFTTFESDDYDSIGGIMIENLDRIPKKGESVTLEDGTVITASVMNKTRIMRVTVVLPEKHPEEASEDTKASESPKEASPEVSEVSDVSETDNGGRQGQEPFSKASTDEPSGETDLNLS